MWYSPLALQGLHLRLPRLVRQRVSRLRYIDQNLLVTSTKIVAAFEFVFTQATYSIASLLGSRYPSTTKAISHSCSLCLLAVCILSHSRPSPPVFMYPPKLRRPHSYRDHGRDCFNRCILWVISLYVSLSCVLVPFASLYHLSSCVSAFSLCTTSDVSAVLQYVLNKLRLRGVTLKCTEQPRESPVEGIQLHKQRASSRTA